MGEGRGEGQVRRPWTLDIGPRLRRIFDFGLTASRPPPSARTKSLAPRSALSIQPQNRVRPRSVCRNSRRSEALEIGGRGKRSRSSRKPAPSSEEGATFRRRFGGFGRFVRTPENSSGLTLVGRDVCQAARKIIGYSLSDRCARCSAGTRTTFPLSRHTNISCQPKGPWAPSTRGIARAGSLGSRCCDAARSLRASPHSRPIRCSPDRHCEIWSPFVFLRGGDRSVRHATRNAKLPLLLMSVCGRPGCTEIGSL